MNSRAPVITGLGVVSSAGVGAVRFWEGLQSREHHFREVSLFRPDGIPNSIASEIGAWVPGYETLDQEHLTQSRISAFAAAALAEALVHSKTEPSDVDRVIVGTTVGDIATIEPKIRTSHAADCDEEMRLRVDVGLRKAVSFFRADVPVELILTACSAGNLALIRACQLIEAGEADVVVAGGAEALSQMAFVGFARMRGMAAARCRPFSDARDGMLLGEGAAFVVVESAGHAAARGAVSLADIVGYGMSCDAKHPTAPDPTGDGIAQAMLSALGGRSPADIDFVCAHGTGTRQNDAAEEKGYSQVFGEARPPVCSIKGSIGHALGAASAIEIVACVLSIQHQKLVPQQGVDGQPTLDLSLVSDPAPADQIDLVLNNAFAFWGNNSCVALARPKQPRAPNILRVIPKAKAIHLGAAMVVSDHPVKSVDGVYCLELDSDELNWFDRRFRSRRSAVVVAALEHWLKKAQPSDIPKPHRRSVVLGTETGAGADIEKFLAESINRGDAIVNPGMFPWTVHNAAVGAAAIAGECRGPNIVISSGAQSGNSAYQQSVALLEAGLADLVYCGVFESLGDSQGTIAAITALSTKPEFLGASYLGPHMQVNLSDNIVGEQGVLRWAKNFAINGAEITELGQ